MKFIKSLMGRSQYLAGTLAASNLGIINKLACISEDFAGASEKVVSE